MPVTLVVEDGTGVDGANTYVDLDGYKDYAEGHPWAVTKTDPELDALLVYMFRRLNALRWVGVPVAVDQAAAWPRAEVPNPRNTAYTLATNVVPQQVPDAQCLGVLYFARLASDPGAYNVLDQFESVRVGPVAATTVQAGDDAGTAARARDALPGEVLTLLQGLVYSSAGYRRVRRVP